jgi:hypothetical protein
VSDLSRRLASVPDDHLIAELQSALDNLDLTDMLPQPEPFVWKPSEPNSDGDRDYPGPNPCPSCEHDLELDADFRCTRCGCQC